MLDNIDLKSLKILIDLNETRNTYATAERLGVSQSSVARSLGKCRENLNDKLFVRSSGRLQPTSFGEHLISCLPGIVDDFEAAVYARSSFDPMQLKGQYQLCINRPIQTHLGAELFNRLTEQAPKADWYIKSSESNLVEQLLDGRVTMGINYYNHRFPKSIRQQTIGSDELVLLASENHPMVQSNEMRIEDTLKFDFVVLSLPGWDESQYYFNQVFAGLDHIPNVKLQTDSLSLAMQVCRSSNMLLALSKSMNRGYTGLRAIHFDSHTPAFPTADIATSVAQKNADAPLAKWLSKLVKSLIKEQLPN